MCDHLQVAPRRGQDRCSSVNSRGCGDDCRGQEAGNVWKHRLQPSFSLAASTSTWQKELLHGAASARAPWVVAVLFHPLSGWHWSCRLPLFPQALHPSNCPSSFLTLPCQFAAVLGVVCGLDTDSLGGEVGGREQCLAAGGAGCWSRQHRLEPTAARLTRSSAFPHLTKLVLILPETLLLHTSDLEISLSFYSLGVASLNKTRRSLCPSLVVSVTVFFANS